MHVTYMGLIWTCMGPRDQNSGPRACAASILPGDSSQSCFLRHLHIAWVDFEFLIFLSLPPEFWKYWHVIPCYVYVVLRIKPKALYILDKYPIQLYPQPHKHLDISCLQGLW